MVTLYVNHHFRIILNKKLNFYYNFSNGMVLQVYEVKLFEKNGHSQVLIIVMSLRQAIVINK